MVSKPATLAALATLLFSVRANADVAISTDPTQNMNCSGGVCMATASDAVLNVSDLENLLASGNVEVTTTGSGIQANNIDVTGAFGWSSTSTLSLDAYESIAFTSAVSVAGKGGLSLSTNNGGSNGTLTFGRTGSTIFRKLSGALTINGAPYMLVDSIQNLAAAIAANPAGSYALAKPYDAGRDGTYSATPVPTTFTGTFEGLGNTISNFKLDDSADSNVGLFAEIGTGGTVRDVGLPNAHVTAQGGEVGPLVGLSYGSVFGCSASGSLNAKNGFEVGGLVGSNAGQRAITNSYSSVSVLDDGTVLDASVGGLAGFSNGEITNSYTTGNVNDRARQANVGGLVGLLGGATLDVTYATGDVSGGLSARAGALVGQSWASGLIENSYATGSVSVKHGISGDRGSYYSFAGGLVGENGYPYSLSYIQSSYSRGAPAGPARHTAIGGSLGNNDWGTATDIYWDTTTSGTDNGVGEGSASGVTGLTTSQLQSGLPAGFDPAVWGEQAGINQGLPYLLAIPPQS